jgi:two-component system cell cycle sensor histidine kinase/response regulator CckA
MVEGAMASTRDDVADTNDFFEMSLDNLCVAGFDGYFKRVNPSWTRTLGWTREELLASPVIDFVHPEDREVTLGGRQSLHRGAGMGPLINRYRCKDGSYRWFEWRSVAHADRALVYAAARDVTEKKLADERLAEANAREEALRRQLTFADRMASVGTLASGVAHEINNPLASVVANLALIVESIELTPGRPEELRKMLDDAQEGAVRIGAIVRGLKTFSRPEEERRAVVGLHTVMDAAVSLTLHGIRQRARLVKDYGQPPLVDIDEARMAQVFVNLLVNATQSFAEGHSDENEIRIATSTDASGRAVIEIRDTGQGIPPLVLGRIFDPFFTTKSVGAGTGLGLSICHAIVTAMGGEISATSELGRGTVFHVVLPAANAVPSAVAATIPIAVAPAALARGTILVVDDEPAVGAALGRVLRDHKVTVVTAAQKALDLIASGTRFDVILSDLMMPEMSGMDFYAELARRFPNAARRVVFVSGGAFTPKAQAFLDSVPNLCMDKPIDPKQLRDRVQQFLHDESGDFCQAGPSAEERTEWT